MKYLFLIGTLLLINCDINKKEPTSILGKWEFQKAYDLRTKVEKEKVGFISVQNGHFENPTKIIMKDGTYAEEYMNGMLHYGIWEIKNDTLFLSTEVESENYEVLKTNSVLKANIRFKKGDCYYMNAGDSPIKSLSRNALELGSENLYDSYKRVK